MAQDRSQDQGPDGYDAEPADVAAGGTARESGTIDRTSREHPGDGGTEGFRGGDTRAGEDELERTEQ